MRVGRMWLGGVVRPGAARAGWPYATRWPYPALARSEGVRPGDALERTTAERTLCGVACSRRPETRPIACSKAQARPRSHSRSSWRRCSRSTCRGTASRRCRRRDRGRVLLSAPTHPRRSVRRECPALHEYVPRDQVSVRHHVGGSFAVGPLQHSRGDGARARPQQRAPRLRDTSVPRRRGPGGHRHGLQPWRATLGVDGAEVLDGWPGRGRRRPTRRDPRPCPPRAARSAPTTEAGSRPPVRPGPPVRGWGIPGPTPQLTRGGGLAPGGTAVRRQDRRPAREIEQRAGHRYGRWR